MWTITTIKNALLPDWNGSTTESVSPIVNTSLRKESNSQHLDPIHQTGSLSRMGEIMDDHILPNIHMQSKRRKPHSLNWQKILMKVRCTNFIHMIKKQICTWKNHSSKLYGTDSRSKKALRRFKSSCTRANLAYSLNCRCLFVYGIHSCHIQPAIVRNSCMQAVRTCTCTCLCK